MKPKRFSIPEFLDHSRDVIDRHGHIVQVVMGTPDAPGWAYTVGLHRHRLPELIIIGGLAVDDQHGILNELAQRMRAGERFEAGDRESTLLVGFDATFVEVADTSTEDFAVANRLQSGFRALQVVWPDHDNRFPWEDGHALPAECQRLLGLP